MKFFSKQYAILILILGLVMLAGGVLSVKAQDSERRDWQQAHQRTERMHNRYDRDRTDGNRRAWQEARNREQRIYNVYQRALRSDRYNDRYRDNDRYNGRYNAYNRMHRIRRGGRYYSFNERGIASLRRAINLGYSNGYQQGVLDRRYRRRYNYRDEALYRNGRRGYQALVPANQYRYYFRQGFQRGYQDGFYNARRYGNRYGNSATMFGNVLGSILDLVD
jgi:hypothetical protein